MNGNHDFTVESRVEKRFVGSPMRWRAECPCGWVAEWRRQKSEAMADGLVHQAVATDTVEPPEAA